MAAEAKNRRARGRALALGLGCFLLGIGGASAGAQDPAVETIVVFRHGEKPPPGLGQLDCTGLNRSLALPPVLVGKFGKPTALFAPDPAVQIMDGSNGPYSYIRPLATIEPTAITLQMPVNTQYGFDAVDALQAALTQPGLASSTVFVAWEHGHIPQIVRGLLQTFNAKICSQVNPALQRPKPFPSLPEIDPNHNLCPSDVPGWGENDYDTIYVVRIVRPDIGPPVAEFSQTIEGLTGKLSTLCLGFTP